jgi:hypothetical protein
MTRFYWLHPATLFCVLLPSYLIFSSLIYSTPAFAAPELLFYVSARDSLTADQAGGDAEPNFRDGITRTHTGIQDAQGNQGWAIEWADEGVLSWNAPGNIYAQRGTLSFFWRAGYPLGEAPFVIFRVGYADHSSWDMAWLRIDWNGSGFDAFVTDANLARTRVSYHLPTKPAPQQWLHIAFSWDEQRGVILYVDGTEVVRKTLNAPGNFDSGLDQFGLAGRVLSPHQVQSRYNFLRGSHIAELRIYDAMVDTTEAAALAANKALTTSTPSQIAQNEAQQAWAYRHGWEQNTPPPLLKPGTNRFRKVELSDTRDLKQWMWKATDGIAETTWPGVYNRSRLPGRNDYFQLPDWNTYVEGGKHFDIYLPDEPINRVEIRGAAYGELQYRASADERFKTLQRRPQGSVRSVYELRPLQGGQLRFSNREQETPIQEFWAYKVDTNPEPQGSVTLRYRIRADAAPDFDNLAPLREFIAGRHPAGERDTVIAAPRGATLRKRDNAPVSTPGNNSTPVQNQPLVHVLIPASVSHAPAGKPLTRSWAYGWENMHHGLDGIAIDLPALRLKPTHKGGVIPLNIRVKDPLWPMRDMLDISVSIKPNQPYTLWLDLRDRILTDDSLYFTIASAAPEFNSSLLNDAEVRLIFKPRAQALAEHTADRFNQVRDNWGFLVEEHTTSQRQQLYRRAHRDISDLLRVDPDHTLGRLYWAYMSYGNQGLPDFTQPTAPAGIPLWAFRQTEELKLVRHQINWWIDQRQVDYGDFGGGISDDSDLVQQWPALALMGVDPDKINRSITALADAAYRNGMFTNGLGTIETDELHAYEEGINTNSALLLLNWGQPWAVERLMETVNALHAIIKPNPQGHWLFSSNWFSGKKIYGESNWEWQKPYSFPIMHPAIMLGEFNADHRSRNLVTKLADGYLAYGYTADDGQWTLPNEINWRTGATRSGEIHRGAGAGDVPTLFWSAWHWTNDAKYLQVIDNRIARAGLGSLSRLNDNVIDQLGKRDTWGKTLTAAAGPDRDFENFIAWENTGDKTYLEQLYADNIRQKSLSMYFNTEGHWWSDRVDSQHELLQRARLGGIALSRNRTYPGHRVSWRFDDPEGAVQVALLMPRAQQEKFKVIAFNMSDKIQTAQMTGWSISAGHWQLRSGIDTNGDDRIDTPLSQREFDFEKTRSLQVSFPPKQTLILEMELVAAGTPVEVRADLGIGRGDLVRTGQSLQVTVHSLGHKDTPDAMLLLETLDGKIIAQQKIPPLPAPTALLPQRTQVTLRLPRDIDVKNTQVRVALREDEDGNQEAEITQLNNTVLLSNSEENRK